jgi:hypothetical protein
LGKQRTTDADIFGLAWHKHVSRMWTLYTKYLALKKLNKVKQEFVFEILFKNNMIIMPALYYTNTFGFV